MCILVHVLGDVRRDPSFYAWDEYRGEWSGWCSIASGKGPLLSWYNSSVILCSFTLVIVCRSFCSPWERSNLSTRPRKSLVGLYTAFLFAVYTIISASAVAATSIIAGHRHGHGCVVWFVVPPTRLSSYVHEEESSFHVYYGILPPIHSSNNNTFITNSTLSLNNYYFFSLATHI